MIQCLHLNDIRLEEDGDDLFLNGLNKQTDHLTNSQRDEETNISSAVGAFASEQLAVFDGLIRRLSTRRSLKKTANNADNNNKRHSDASLVSKISSTASSTYCLHGGNHNGVGKSDRYKSSAKTLFTPPSSSKTSRASMKRTEMLPLTSSNMNHPSHTTMNLFCTMPNNNANLSCQNDLSSQAALNQCLHEEMQTSFENIIRKTKKNQQNAQNRYQQESPSSSSHGQSSFQNTSKAARQRRHEWSKHRLSNKASFLKSEDQLPINVINETLDSANSVFTLNDDEFSLATSSMAAIGNNIVARKNLSPNISPNITCLHGTDSAEHVCDVRTYGTNHSNSISSFNSSNNSIMTSNPIADSEMNSHNNSHQSQTYQIMGDYYPSLSNNAIDNMDKMDHVQAYVEQEQLRHELRQTHLLQWKCFAKKLGSQIRSLSLGSLSALDSIFIDILLKHCIVLEELRINNETDILSYLSIIKHTVKRIYINCEHGIG